MDINQLDLELKLLYGSPIYVSNIKTYPIPLSTIIDKIGYTKYNQIVSILSTDDEDIKPYLSIIHDDSNMFWFLYSLFKDNIQIDDNIKTSDFLEYFSFLFNDNVVFDANVGFIIGESGVINNLNFNDLQNVIKCRNCLNDINLIDESGNPADARTKKLIEQRNKLRKKVKELKKSDEDDEHLTMFDLISIFAEAECMKLWDVCEYDIFQFNNQFNRMKIMDDFHVNIQVLLAGGKSEDFKLKHWLSKIETNN